MCLCIIVSIDVGKTIDFTDYLQLNLIVVFRYVQFFLLFFLSMQESINFSIQLNLLLLLLVIVIVAGVSEDTIQVGDDNDDNSEWFLLLFFLYLSLDSDFR